MSHISHPQELQEVDNARELALDALPQIRRRFRELAIGSGIACFSLGLFIAHIVRDSDSSGMPPWIQSLTPDELEQLRVMKDSLDRQPQAPTPYREL